MESVGGIFSHALERWSKNPDFRAGMAAVAWQSVVGPEVAAQVQLVRVVNGVGWVRATSPVWAHQLTYLKPDILRRLADKLGPKAITDLRVERGLARPPQRAVTEVAVQVSEADQALIARCAEPVEDAALQAAFRTAMAAHCLMQERMRAEGWLSCHRCGALTDHADRVCLQCTMAAREARHRALLAAMTAAPWASQWDLQKTLPDITPQEYGKLRILMLRNSWRDGQTWLARHQPTDPAPPGVLQAFRMHVMLRVMKPWEQITPDMIEHYAGQPVRVLLTARPGGRKYVRPDRPASADGKGAPATPASQNTPSDRKGRYPQTRDRRTRP
ncbi:MAG TPA: DUF721 domain-containing protein [Candidatus Xenobia bacterium]|jgi:hypothetical protein